MQDLAATLKRPTEHDEALVDEPIHEAGMLLEARLLAQIAREVPRPAALYPYGEEHTRSVSVLSLRK